MASSRRLQNSLPIKIIIIQSDLWLLVADVRRRRHPAVAAVWCRIRGFCWGRMEMKEEVVVVVVVKRGGGGGG